MLTRQSAWWQEADLSHQELHDHYLELVLLMRKMYQQCHLVHADLSEFNVLVHEVRPGCLLQQQYTSRHHPVQLCNDSSRVSALHANGASILFPWRPHTLACSSWMMTSVRQLISCQDTAPCSATLRERTCIVHACRETVPRMQGQLVMLDVSQSVDLDHPHALEFLRADALHVNTFFRRKGVPTLTTRELFDFVVDPSTSDSNLQAAVSALLAVAEGRSSAPADDVDDMVSTLLTARSGTAAVAQIWPLLWARDMHALSYRLTSCGDQTLPAPLDTWHVPAYILGIYLSWQLLTTAYSASTEAILS